MSKIAVEKFESSAPRLSPAHQPAEGEAGSRHHQGNARGAGAEHSAFLHQAYGLVIEKVLRSAIQNATYVSQEQGLDVDVDNLYVRTAVANEGPRMKRIRPAPLGRAFRYQRRLAHIIVTVAEKKSGAGLAKVVDDAPAAAKSKPAKTAAKKTAAEEGSGLRRLGVREGQRK